MIDGGGGGGEKKIRKMGWQIKKKLVRHVLVSMGYLWIACGVAGYFSLFSFFFLGPND